MKLINVPIYFLSTIFYFLLLGPFWMLCLLTELASISFELLKIVCIFLIIIFGSMCLIPVVYRILLIFDGNSMLLLLLFFYLPVVILLLCFFTSINRLFTSVLQLFLSISNFQLKAPLHHCYILLVFAAYQTFLL